MSTQLTIGISYSLGGKVFNLPATTLTMTNTGKGFISATVTATAATPLLIDSGDIATLKTGYFRNLSSTTGEWVDVYDDTDKLTRVGPGEHVVLDLSKVAVADLKIVADTLKTPVVEYTLTEA